MIRESYGAHFEAPVGVRPESNIGRYESARSAIYAWCCASHAKRLFVPHYICDSVPAAIRAAGVNVAFYVLDDQLSCSDDLLLGDGDYLFLVDYFGLCSSAITKQLKRFPSDRIVVDRSQAWFAAPCPEVAATVFSPRKFLPVPDGGLIVTSLPLHPDQADERGSWQRYDALLGRIGMPPEASRESYLAAEQSLETITVRGMSHLTNSLISSAESGKIASTRRGNFQSLDRVLGPINQWRWTLGDQVPIAYPFAVGSPALRTHLIARRVFAPCYWPGAATPGPVEQRLVHETAFLPIDHRYEPDGMTELAETILTIVENEL